MRTSSTIHYAYLTTTLGDLLVREQNNQIINLQFISQSTRAFINKNRPKASTLSFSDTTKLFFPGSHPFIFSEALQHHILAPDFGLFKETAAQINAFFRGAINTFSVPCQPYGTAFQERVWQHMLHIPYGCTLSYSTLAAQLGMPKGARAVASAVARNPILLLVPCHRVVDKKNGSGGYSGGILRKQALLALEKSNSDPPGALS